MPSLVVNPDGSKHTHSFVRCERIDGKPSQRYRCSHPDCTSTELRVNLVGKRSLCPLCMSNDFILSYEKLKLKKPHCDFCGKAGTDRKSTFADRVAALDKELGFK